ncbi:MAG: DEAD/DEAH box helicase family protein [Candidatus Lokiarchaeota archaeon]|nr:DEAD/DEAH box helicase family protein [Candidatus Lokiarchaeota archaeon]
MVMRKIQYFNDSFLKKNKIEYRHYQNNILNDYKNKNSLIVLATGLGKTIIGILLIIERLKKYNKNGKIIILAPTRPLVIQHYNACKKFIDIEDKKISYLTGKISPIQRINIIRNSRIVISTPQVIKNDLLRNRYNLSHVPMIIFDEAHRAKGNYAYCFIAEEYINSCSDPLIIGLTASPGKDYSNIQELCNNLLIENIIFKNYNDDDVKQYLHDIEIIVEKIDLPIKILELAKILEDLFSKFLSFFIERTLLEPQKRYYSKLDFLKIAEDLTFSLKYQDLTNNGYFDEIEFEEHLYFKEPRIIDIVKEKKLNIHSIYSYCSSCISILHLKDILETQEISMFKNYIEKIKYRAEQDNLSAKRILNSEHLSLIHSIMNSIDTRKLIHPKIEKTILIIENEIKEYSNTQIIIFTQYREIAEILKNKINSHFRNQLIAEKFIGQSSKIDDIGYSQKEQIRTLNDFREDKINILTATSIAEEGLDIPNVKAIIFYEPVASEIRYIQRRGRTGRHSDGRCYILIADNTIDVPFFKVAQKKEDTMNSILINSDQLNLIDNIGRNTISFKNVEPEIISSDFMQAYNINRKKENQFLLKRSVDIIIDKIDKFSESEQYKTLKKHNITFLSDLCNLNKKTLENKIVKIKNQNSAQNNQDKKKLYLNKHLKTIIKLVENYSKEGKINLLELRKLAEFEDIIDKTFDIHFNHACNLGYIEKKKHHVYLKKKLIL